MTHNSPKLELPRNTVRDPPRSCIWRSLTTPKKPSGSPTPRASRIGIVALSPRPQTAKYPSAASIRPPAVAYMVTELGNSGISR